MDIANLPDTVRVPLRSAFLDLGINEASLGFWEVSDYGIFVLMTERFYKTLKFRTSDPHDFIDRRKRGDLPFAGTYQDSRQYMAMIIEHLRDCGLAPNVIDVGGYIGRFSIESALLMREKGFVIPIQCFEPGLTGNIIRANFEVNDIAHLVRVRSEAVSDAVGTADYKYARDVLISGRINRFPSATAHKTVNTTRLDHILSEAGCSGSAIIKIDTEGHEPSVMAGLGRFVSTTPLICIVEFWPQTLTEKVNGEDYADFIETNFSILNIKSSLYPKFYAPVWDVRQFARDFKKEEGNVDLLLVSKHVPRADSLVSGLMSLGGGRA